MKRSDYTEGSWGRLQTALNNALSIQADDDASQKCIDDATEALLFAIEDLVEIEKPEVPEDVDKSELAKAIEAAKALDASDYTEESWSVFNKELTEALLVLEDEDASQADVDEALAALVAAIDNLVEKVTEDPEVEDEDKDDEDGKGDKNDKDGEDGKSPKTGDESKLLLYLVLLVLSGATPLSMFVRRKIKKA